MDNLFFTYILQKSARYRSLISESCALLRLSIFLNSWFGFLIKTSQIKEKAALPQFKKRKISLLSQLE